MDDRLRAIARAARAEAEAAIDVDDELAATMQRTPTDFGPRRGLERQRRRTVAWVAAAAVVLISGGLVVLRSVDDDTLQSVDTETTTAITSPSSSPATTDLSDTSTTSTTSTSTTSTVAGEPVTATFVVDIATRRRTSNSSRSQRSPTRRTDAPTSPLVSSGWWSTCPDAGRSHRSVSPVSNERSNSVTSW